jgi:hypothetical protein
MKKTTFSLFILAMAMVVSFSSCTKDDDTTTPVPTTPANPIIGTWKSVGADIAFLLKFPPVNSDSLWASFSANNTYQVKSFDTAGTALTFSGTWTANKSSVGNIYTITLNQSTPSAVTSEGIFEVSTASPDSMYYEVLQTNPTLTGFTGPTPATGFGTTAGPGLQPGWNLQKFRRLSN